jgi:hypothetical protein
VVVQALGFWPRWGAHAGGEWGAMVEVAETSEDDDRQIKVPLYARRGIDEVWDLRQRRLIVYRDLAAESYRTAQSFQSSEAVSSSGFPDKLCVVARGARQSANDELDQAPRRIVRGRHPRDVGHELTGDSDGGGRIVLADHRGLETIEGQPGPRRLHERVQIPAVAQE